MIKLKVEGQYLNIKERMVLASDSQDYVSATFEFDDDWNGLTKTAVFYQNADTVYHAILVDDSCIVPYEALAEKEQLYIGVFGVEGTKRITTNFVNVFVHQGSYGDGLTPEEPSEDIYAQIVAIMEQQSIDAQTTFQYQETTKGYRDETLGLKTDVENTRDAFDVNATNKTNTFNDNATSKTNAFDTNATNKITTFNDNATSKTNSFNSNYDGKIITLNELETTTEGYKNTTKEYMDTTEEYKDLAFDYKEEAKESETNAGLEADRALNNILNGVSTHNQDITAHSSLIEDIRTVEAIARGKATGYVFDTYQDMLDWLEIPDNVETLVVGDNLYIRDTGVKDYWWDGTTYQELEAEAPDLTNYYTKMQVDSKMPILITRDDYNALVSAGTVQADRTYDIIEEV